MRRRTQPFAAFRAAVHAMAGPASPASFRRALASVALCLAMVAPAAHAGPWPRERGGGYVGLSHRIGAAPADWPDGPSMQYSAIFVEYGLTDRLTLGLDAGRSVAGQAKAVAFLNYPLPTLPGRLRLAVQLGAGTIDSQPVLRPGISVGRSIVMGRLGGWISLDGLAEYFPDASRVDLKLDATAGLNMAGGRTVTAQVQTGQTAEGAHFMRIAAGYSTRPLWLGIRLEAGLEAGVLGDNNLILRLGLSRTF